MHNEESLNLNAFNHDAGRSPSNDQGGPPVGRSGKRKQLKLKPGLLERVYNLVAILGIVNSQEQLYERLNRIFLQSDQSLSRSDISWTGFGLNCLVGCTYCSLGCQNCYAEDYHDSRHQIFVANNGRWPDSGDLMPIQYAKPFRILQLLPERVGRPLRTRKVGRCFVNAFSDVFHPSVPVEFIQDMFLVMAACPHIVFQVLTKRPERMLKLADKLPWPPNVHVGVTIEDETTMARADLLRHLPEHVVKWISAEPLLRSIKNLNLAGISWVIFGGESGPMEKEIRPAHADWARELRDKCAAEGVAFFFKQTGDWVHESQLADTGLTEKTKGRPVHVWPDGTKSFRFGRVIIHDRLDGREHKEYPTQ